MPVESRPSTEVLVTTIEAMNEEELAPAAQAAAVAAAEAIAADAAAQIAAEAVSTAEAMVLSANAAATRAAARARHTARAAADVAARAAADMATEAAATAEATVVAATAAAVTAAAVARHRNAAASEAEAAADLAAGASATASAIVLAATEAAAKALVRAKRTAQAAADVAAQVAADVAAEAAATAEAMIVAATAAAAETIAAAATAAAAEVASRARPADDHAAPAGVAATGVDVQVDDSVAGLPGWPGQEWAPTAADPVLPLFSATLEPGAVVHPPGQLALWRDISLASRMHAALRASEAQFEMAFHCAPTALLIATVSDGRPAQFVRVNEAFTRLTGRPAVQLVGSGFAELAHVQQRAADLALGRPRWPGEVERVERWVGRDGRQLWVRIRTEALAAAPEQDQQVVCQVEDVTAQVLAGVPAGSRR